MTDYLSGNQIRKEFIDFFVRKDHKFVPSASLVPGGDQTLLFTNAGMVQFKDVFLGTDKRPYSRAVNSQKCMRVAGKHNDLDDVGRDDYHHTFFEMLGNWSFGDYYKKEAIAWAWELLTDVWGLDKSKLWVTCFKDERNEIPTDEEAANNWHLQIGLDSEHILFFGRKDNFWEMADTGPCGPCSEIHYDRGQEFCEKTNDPQHHCSVNGDCHRFLELWNLVFIQYNRLNPSRLEKLPTCHVDTGMGFERIVSVLQHVDSNYKTDLLMPLIDVVVNLCNKTPEEMEKNFTPYRVIADHSRAAAFLIADGVVPGNIGRNYVTRMIIRRAARFGSKLGLIEPFMSSVAEKVIEIYGEAYPELKTNRETILNNLTQEEQRFRSTVESGLTRLEEEIQQMPTKELAGSKAFDLYATHGLPLEIIRDVLRERGLEVDQQGFYQAMQAHRMNSGAGKEFGPLGGDNAEFYNQILQDLSQKGEISESGVKHDPYTSPTSETKVLAIIQENNLAENISAGQEGEIIIEKTGFYIESGGQISDTGTISKKSGEGVFEVSHTLKPAAGVIVHVGKVKNGVLHTGDAVIAQVDWQRRQDIMRNHTATHLLHAELRKVLGDHVRQAGSLVAPDRLRFDFTHTKAVTSKEIINIENGVNQRILENTPLIIEQKKLTKAIEEGATALFGEKYAEDVRTIAIGADSPFSYELCGGTHVSETAEIGTFIIISEVSVAAGIRRIEAITGRKAYQFIKEKIKQIQETAQVLQCNPDEIDQAVMKLIQKNESLSNKTMDIKTQLALQAYLKAKTEIKKISGMDIMRVILSGCEVEILRNLADKFRQDFSNGIAIFASIFEEEAQNTSVQIVIAVADSLVKQGLNAGDLAKSIASRIGGSGGGRPHLAQAGGKDIKGLQDVLEKIESFLQKV